MLKAGGDALKRVMLDTFNHVLRPDSPAPSSWKHTVIKVLHKSSDPMRPENYRPIATTPVHYKLFSKLLSNRLCVQLDCQQSPGQAGFRPNRSTTDHLFTTAVLIEISDEWHIPLWMAAIGSRKAFDSVAHEAIWKALEDQQVPVPYITLLRKFQTPSVKTDRFSKEFNIERGTEQGDPLS
eukprot:1357820-Pyramimonas_sp.AAC.1